MRSKLIIAFLIIAVLFACKKEEKITNNASAKLSFGQDSLKFDTVFTTVGSVTQSFKVFNFNKNAVRISEIKLGGGASSAFQINIDGNPVNSLQDVVLKGNDSLKVFVKVIINPNATEKPFIVSDSITFLTNGNRQALYLEAYGQNAHFLKGAFIDQNTTWDKKIPYVIYDTVKVNAGKTLTVEKGSRIYFHKDAKMVIAGTLNVKGVLKDSVTFSSDRLELIYKSEPGQWRGLKFLATSQSNQINYATLRNASIALDLEAMPVTVNPKLLLTNSIITYIQIAGIAANHTSIAAFNNLITNCGQYIFYAVNGGNYNLKQNTFANLGNTSFSVSRLTPSLYFTDFAQTNTNPLQIALVNNIIWGSLADELAITTKNAAVSIIQNNLIRSKSSSYGTSNVLNQDPMFVNYQRDNYKLNTGSAALAKGQSLTNDAYYYILKSDLKEKLRIFPSSLGSYEPD